MNAINKPVENSLLACDACLREIPADEAKNEEATDYVIHYYGLECYAKWSKQLVNRKP